MKDLKTQKDLCALVASLNYYRCFSPRFSFLAQPLFDSLKLDKKEFLFSDIHKAALNELVREIRKSKGLSFLNDENIKNGRHIIYADASNTAMGALITAIADDGVEHPLCFHSKTFSEPYRLKHINILETLAFNMAVSLFGGMGSNTTAATTLQFPPQT